MRYDPNTPCTEVDDVFGGACGATPTDRFLTGSKCRPHAPGATLDGCAHGTPWVEDCPRCTGQPPAPSPVASPSVGREPHPYGAATTDPLGRTITRSDGGKRFDDRLPRHPCPTCARPRAKGHKGDCIEQRATERTTR